MCNCRKKIEAKLFETIYQQKPEAANLKVELGGYGFMIKGNQMIERPVAPINIEYDHTQKNGKVVRKKESIPFALAHCPHCGEEVEKKEENPG